ncbi:MAG: L-serine ammonia-lyase, iron-sulfur-dependent, subunit alpha [Sporomusaceae bacterium]|nr:L-serine ammonia-lyase, iron-sulfur-dependent, subunit alpha [Sporomusaceae bacterium]
MIRFSTFADLIALAKARKGSIASVVIAYEAEKSQRSEASVREDMARCLQVMKEAVEKGRSSREKSVSGMVGGDAAKMGDFMTLTQAKTQQSLLGETVQKALLYALSVSEVNAKMGRIVASPTAGSCGILPGALLAAGETLQKNDEALVDALFTASGVGLIIQEHASLAGALGGCQAECGSAAAMAAAAITELAGGSPEQTGHALALAFKNLLGLVCDPVAGLVEVPCVKRNGFGASHALIAAELALAGVESVIPPDEVITASQQIGRLLPQSLRETSEAGLADTPTARAIEKKVLG